MPNRMCEIKHNRAKHKSRTRNAKCNADSHRYGIRSSDGRIDARALSDITNYSTHRKRLEAPSLGKAAKLESRPENANRANPELRALGHQTPNDTPNAFTALDHTGHHCSLLTPYPASRLPPYRPCTSKLSVPDIIGPQLRRDTIAVTVCSQNSGTRNRGR